MRAGLAAGTAVPAFHAGYGLIAARARSTIGFGVA